MSVTPWRVFWSRVFWASVMSSYSGRRSLGERSESAGRERGRGVGMAINDVALARRCAMCVAELP